MAADDGEWVGIVGFGSLVAWTGLLASKPLDGRSDCTAVPFLVVAVLQLSPRSAQLSFPSLRHFRIGTSADKKTCVEATRA